MIVTAEWSQPLFVSKVEQNFDPRALVYTYFVTIHSGIISPRGSSPSPAKIEIPKDLYHELDKRLRDGVPCKVSLVLR